jgi:ABC-2 type transport system permease protein
MKTNKIKNKINTIKAFLKTYTYESVSDFCLIFSDIIIGISIPVFIQIILWNYVYSETTEINGYSNTKVILYAIITIIFSRFNNGHNIIVDTSEYIKNGIIDLYNIKPVSYKTFQLLKFCGQNTIYFPLITIFTTVSLFLFGDLNFIIAIIIFIIWSQYISFQLSYILGMFSYWLINDKFLSFLYFVSLSIFGGMLIPIEFWPENIQIFLKYNPFRLLVSGIPDFILNPKLSIFINLLCLFIFYTFILNYIIKIISKHTIKYCESNGG